jgi:hypothetical protein
MLNLILEEQNLLTLKHIKKLLMYLNLKREKKIKTLNMIALEIKEENCM